MSVDEKDVDAAVVDGLAVLKLELDTLLLAVAEADESETVKLVSWAPGAALLLDAKDETSTSPTRTDVPVAETDGLALVFMLFYARTQLYREQWT